VDLCSDPSCASEPHVVRSVCGFIEDVCARYRIARVVLYSADRGGGSGCGKRLRDACCCALLA
jgi:hypothetical protein